MSDIELYKKEFDNLVSTRSTALEDAREITNKNIGNVREFSTTILTIDLALVGGLIALLGSDKSSLIYSRPVLIFAVAILFLDAIFITFSLDSVLINQNRKLRERYDFLSKTFTEAIDLLIKEMQKGTPFDEFRKIQFTKTQEYIEQEKQYSKPSSSITATHLRWTNYLFIAGLLLAVISLIPFNYIFSVMPGLAKGV